MVLMGGTSKAMLLKIATAYQLEYCLVFAVPVSTGFTGRLFEDRQ